jgi:cysteinyl-tRNA synthetase
MLYLGETIDIHAGGVDLVFPHHENEIAQSEAYTGKSFVKYWFHGEHLLIEGKKMSKSLGNLYSLDQLVKKYSVDSLAFRMLCLQSNYRDKLNFTDKSIRDAQNTLNNLRNFVTRVSQMDGVGPDKVVAENIKYADKMFREALSDDLNTSRALAVIFDFITDTNKLLETNRRGAKEIISFIGHVDEVLGLNLSPEKADAEVQKLFKSYLAAKINKDWEKSDKLRQNISELGWVAEDTKCESILRKK